MKEPKNYAFWLSIIKDPEKTAAFMATANERQKKEIRKVFKYVESQNKSRRADLFDE